MSVNQQLLQSLYAAFNKREIETIVEAMHPDVKWANGLEGGFIYGREAGWINCRQRKRIIERVIHLKNLKK